MKQITKPEGRYLPEISKMVMKDFKVCFFYNKAFEFKNEKPEYGFFAKNGTNREIYKMGPFCKSFGISQLEEHFIEKTLKEIEERLQKMKECQAEVALKEKKKKYYRNNGKRSETF